MDQPEREWTLDEIVEGTTITIDKRQFFDDWQNTDGDGQELETFDDGINRLHELPNGAIKVTGTWSRPDNQVGHWEGHILHDQVDSRAPSEWEAALIEAERRELANAWSNYFNPAQ